MNRELGIMLISTFEERLSVVPRWSIVRTIQKQTVDQHSYRVTLIAARLAVFLAPKNMLNEVKKAVMEFALLHDQREAFTGDIPTPAGRRIDKAGMEDAFSDYCYELPYGSDLVRAIVKLADLIEALLFLKVEMSLGNTTVGDIVVDVSANMDAHLEKMGWLQHRNMIFRTLNQFGVGQQQDPLND